MVEFQAIEPTKFTMGSTGETMELNTSLGKIRGLVVTAPNGKKVAKFLGIPYAKQPIGKLRFKPLEQLDLPLGTDESPFEALKIGPSSIQAGIGISR